MSDIVYFSKLHPKAIIPSKIDENGGWDVYACFDENYMVIEPFSMAMIPTGIASAFDKKYCMVLHERGSTGKINMKRAAGVIDSGFRNQWFVMLYNGNDKKIIIHKPFVEGKTIITEEDRIELVFREWDDEEGVHHKHSWVIHRGEKHTRNLEDLFILYPYEKAISQALLIEVPQDIDIQEIPYEQLVVMKSVRGLGMLGSSEK